MPACCIVFTTDTSYLFPTLVSAIQARRFSSTTLADVLIIGVGLDPDAVQTFGPICVSEGIRLLEISADDIETHSAMLARLYLNQIVSSNYSQFLYLDGDVQIHQSLDPLIEAAVPAGHVLAANDPIAFLLSGNSPMAYRLSKYFRSVGVPSDVTDNYFNSGVLRMPRDGWDVISAAALDHHRTHHQLARFPDQDGLNIAARGRRLPMSLTWNFPVFLRNARLENHISPRITHFMASPKPWNGIFAPWDSDAGKPYLDAVTRYPELKLFEQHLSFRDRAAYGVKQMAKRYSEAVVWGVGARRKRILDYEQQHDREGISLIPGLAISAE